MERITVLIPTYNNQNTIQDTLKSVLRQTYEDFSIIVVDNNSQDNTVNVVNYMNSDKIRVFINPVNIGCGRNLTKCVSLANTDVIYFLCGDDIILDKSTLWLIAHAFEKENISLVTRGYYWFDVDPQTPIRRKKSYDDENVRIISSLDQISGISMRRSRILNDFSTEPFMEMVSVGYPMIMKSCNAGFLTFDTVAVRVHPMSSDVFKKSPIRKWYKLLKNDAYLIKNFVARNYVGLVQIKNYGTYWQLLREIGLLVVYRPMNLLSIKFWFYTLTTLVVPRVLLKKMVELYRRIPK